MTWVVFRLHRTEGLISGAVLALLTVFLVTTGLLMAHTFQKSGLAACLARTGDPNRCGLLKWKRWLLDHDLPVYGPYDQQAYQDLVLADPDGVLPETATRGPGFERTRDGDEVYAPRLESVAPYRNEEVIGAHTWRQPVPAIEVDMALEGLRHVATIASSLPRTDAFYQGALALPLVRKTLGSDDPEVERWCSRAVYGRAGPGIARHYALDLGSPGTIADWVTSLSAVGIEGISIVDEEGGPAISIDDPDGQDIELMTAGSDAGRENR